MARISYRKRIYEDYRNRILHGSILPGDRLVDSAIAAELGVSRMPVRDALMKLASEGYLTGTSRGFTLPDLSHKQILEVFELRRLLEPRAASAAAQTMTPATLSRLQQAADASASTRPGDDITPLFRASEAFRNIWLEAVPNIALRETIQRYLGQVQTVRLATFHDPQSHPMIITGQLNLLQAFQNRDVLAAGDCMLQFVLAAEERYEAMRGADGPDAEQDNQPGG